MPGLAAPISDIMTFCEKIESVSILDISLNPKMLEKDTTTEFEEFINKILIQ